jgi:transcriptional regulator with XRE-family HTH domain
MTNTEPVHSDRPNAGTGRGNGFDGPRARTRVGPERESPRPPAAGANANGADLARARTCVGPESACTPCESVSVHWGSVPDDERDFLMAGFGAELIRLRKAAALSQARLGDLAGLRGDHVGRLERGRRRPTVAAIRALCRILAPGTEREATESRLAVLAGDSLREGAERRKQARDNRHRRAALSAALKAQRTMTSVIRAQESRGEIVAGNLRKMAESLGETLARLRAESVPETGIKGVEGRDARPRRPDRPRSRSMKDLEAWLDSHGGDDDQD